MRPTALSPHMERGLYTPDGPTLKALVGLRGFPAQGVGSSNKDVSDLPCLLVSLRTSQADNTSKKGGIDSYYPF
ncbi:hypothetical protein Tco_0257317 [Tanacetum coccineum]